MQEAGIVETMRVLVLVHDGNISQIQGDKTEGVKNEKKNLSK